MIIHRKLFRLLPDIMGAFRSALDEEFVSEVRKDGQLVVVPPPGYAYSHNEKRTAPIFIQGSHQDYIDEKDQDPEDKT